MRGYQEGNHLLGGWLLIHEWIDETGAHHIGYNTSPGVDWPRTLGMMTAAKLLLEQDYLTPDDPDEG